MSALLMVLFVLESLVFAVVALDILLLHKLRTTALLSASGVAALLGVALAVLTIRGPVSGSLRVFLLLTGFAPAAMLVCALLHNLLPPLIFKIIGKEGSFEEPFFFILAVFVCPLAFLVGTAGTVVSLVDNMAAKYLIIGAVLVAIIVLVSLMRTKPYTIATEKDSSFRRRVEKIAITVKVGERLQDVFAHSFEHSMVTAFQSNGVEAVVTVLPPESDDTSEHGKGAEAFSPEPTLLIDVNPIYREREDGYQAVVGTDFDASLTDVATKQRVWHATGKVDYIKIFPPHYRAGEGVRKEFAWHTTAAIVKAFIAEVNGQKAAPIRTVTEARQRHGDRTD